MRTHVVRWIVRWAVTGVLIAIGVAAFAAAVSAQQQPLAYPAKGQSANQQQKDQAECYIWAKNTTGVDPAVASSNVPQKDENTFGGGQRVRGAARGALGGAAIGAIAGDAGKGAGAGAVAGTMVGGYRARQDRDQAYADAKAQHADVLNTYYRAFGACMEGRGYTIR
jgi:hypothetical protein